MRRRCTHLLFVVAYSASQLAAIPHAHGASCDSPHPANAHLHVSWFDHAGHDHDEHHSLEQGHEEGQSQSPSSDSTDHRGHDADAIYVANDAATPRAGNGPVEFDNLQLVAALPVSAPAEQENPSACLADDWLARSCSPGCPLYLALRTLRI